MAVLVEATSVILRRDSIGRIFPGGWEAFGAAVPNATLCYDDDIARVGFLSPSEVEGYVKHLQRIGLKVSSQEKYVDLAIVDQCRGLIAGCDWLEFGRFPIGAGHVSACWLFAGPRKGTGVHMKRTMDISTPPGWTFESSLSQRFRFVPTTAADSTTEGQAAV